MWCNMMRFENEAALLDPVSAYIRRKSFRKQDTELAFYEYRIDLYGYSRIQNLTVAIELKLLRWRRAWEQALLYQLCADFVFVALPTYVIPRVDTTLYERHGIGLLSVESKTRCRQILPAQPSREVREYYRDPYIASL